MGSCTNSETDCTPWPCPGSGYFWNYWIALGPTRESQSDQTDKAPAWVTASGIEAVRKDRINVLETAL